MGKSERRKGVEGRCRAIHLLCDRDWNCDPTMEGIKSDDVVVMDPTGKRYSVEVKNTKAITVDHRTQAMRQARPRGLPWMLMSRIYGTRSWLIQRSDNRPVVWNEKEKVE